MDAAADLHIMRARAAKAHAMVKVLIAHDATPAAARALTPVGWEMVATLADVNPPSAATRELTAQLLEAELEARARTIDDPFEGLV